MVTWAVAVGRRCTRLAEVVVSDCFFLVLYLFAWAESQHHNFIIFSHSNIVTTATFCDFACHVKVQLEVWNHLPRYFLACWWAISVVYWCNRDVQRLDSRCLKYWMNTTVLSVININKKQKLWFPHLLCGRHSIGGHISKFYALHNCAESVHLSLPCLLPVPTREWIALLNSKST